MAALMVILHEVITDRQHLIVCGSEWPGSRDGTPPPAWYGKGGPPIHDHRTGATCPACTEGEEA